MLLAMMPALGENPHPAAAASLARHAVFADVRRRSGGRRRGLKRHPLDHYAPLLLSGLQIADRGQTRSASLLPTAT